jgi:hypothetical protein
MVGMRKFATKESSTHLAVTLCSRLGAIIFASFVLAGQIVVAIGATANSYPIVLIGRFIFG